MKKQILLMATLSVLAISCGGKNDKKDNSESTEVQKVVEKIDCGCDEIKHGKLNGKVFTGICCDKDQNDTIILKRNYKNGYLIKSIIKEKVKGKYITIIDLTYDDELPFNGFLLELKGDYSDADVKYTESYTEYKEGKILNEYYCSMFSDQIGACWYVKNGKKLEIGNSLLPEDSRPKCMPDAEPLPVYFENRRWLLKDIENQRDVYEKVVSGLQKEFPKFYYIK